MRLVIDARLLGHSGIGTYLANVLPRILPRCAALRPVLVAQPAQINDAAALAGSSAEVATWAAAPLTAAELRPAPVASAGDLWWAPHFNVPLWPPVPLVVTLHDLLPLSRVAPRSPLYKRVALRGWLAAIRRRARRVICVSDFTRREAIVAGRLDVATVSVVPLGADSRQVAPAPTPTSTAAPYLLSVGLVKPHKNLGGLLAAFEAVAAMIPHRLIVVGRHSGLRDVDAAALATALRLAPRVELREHIPSDELAALMAGADLLIQPSLYEGFGLPPLEAMAAGTPVLAARAGALPEVCGDAALYCDPNSPADIGQRILEALRDEGLRARLCARGRERAGRFTWDACASATADLLLAAAGVAGPGRTS